MSGTSVSEEGAEDKHQFWPQCGDHLAALCVRR
jgi:hypothetical protein